jgi:hypothetical protein
MTDDQPRGIIPPQRASYAIDAIDRGEVLRYLGYRGQAIMPELDARIDAVIGACLEECQPRGTWAVFGRADVREGTEGLPEGVALAGARLTLPGADIARHLDGACAIALMSVTLGMGSERALQRLALTNPMDQVIFDAAANALVERAADAAEAQLVAHAHAQGLYTNDRYAPGYGDLPLTVQAPLLDALDARKALGVTLTPSNMLVPSKSETAVLGLFTRPPERREGGMCGVCAMADFCTLRSQGLFCRR